MALRTAHAAMHLTEERRVLSDNASNVNDTEDDNGKEALFGSILSIVNAAFIEEDLTIWRHRRTLTLTLTLIRGLNDLETSTFLHAPAQKAHSSSSSNKNEERGTRDSDGAESG